jgi:hypothetical protein
VPTYGRAQKTCRLVIHKIWNNSEDDHAAIVRGSAQRDVRRITDSATMPAGRVDP